MKQRQLPLVNGNPPAATKREQARVLAEDVLEAMHAHDFTGARLRQRFADFYVFAFDEDVPEYEPAFKREANAG